MPRVGYAERPLPPDYGSHRPKQLDLSPEHIAEIEEFTGRPIDQVLTTRDSDPRAGHNRDEAGNILDTDGNPREFVDPRQLLLDDQTQQPDQAAQPEQPGQPDHSSRPGQPDRLPARTDGYPSTNVSETASETGEPEPELSEGRADLQAPSDWPDEPDEGGAGEVGERGKADTGESDDGRGELELPDDLGELVGQLATDLRNRNLTREQAADQLESFRHRNDPTAAESTGTEATTEIVRETDGYRSEKGTPEQVPSEVEPSEENRWKELSRRRCR